MDLDRLLENSSFFSARCLPLCDLRGREVMVVIAKLTWFVASRGRCRPLVDGAPIRFTDVPYAGPSGMLASVRFPCDVIDDKPGTDVILIGTAFPPEGRAVTEMDVSVRMETGRRTLAKTVRVYGQRVFYAAAGGVIPGPAARLHPTPLRYEQSFGGPEDRRNPVGIGAVRDRAQLVGKVAPSIEDPRHPVGSLRPAPAGFGPIAPDWSPRCERAGTCDEAWRRTRAPIRPLDYDPRHACVSEPDLFSPEPIAGDEPVEVTGATPEGVWRFKLPRVTPLVAFETSGGIVEQRPRPDTYLIDADEGRVELTFRARVPMPRKIQHLRQIRICAEGELPEGA